MSNESWNDDQGEEGPFQDFVSMLDAARPTVRTGTRTRENDDVHPCGNVTETDEGHLQQCLAGWLKESGELLQRLSA